jgi:hypothetical protein
LEKILSTSEVGPILALIAPSSLLFMNFFLKQAVSHSVYFKLFHMYWLGVT